MDETSQEIAKAANPGWYTNSETNLQQYWDGVRWLDIPAPTQVDGRPIAVAKAETSDLAIIALVFSFTVPFVGWILGFKARAEIAGSNGKKTGGPLATAAIWIGGIATVAIASMIALCTLSAVFGYNFDYNFGDRNFRHHRIYIQDGGRGFGSYGIVPMDPNGGMMYDGQSGLEGR